MKNLIIVGLGALSLASLTTMAHDHEVILVVDNIQPQLESFKLSSITFEEVELSIALPVETNVPAAVIMSDQAVQSERLGKAPYHYHLRPPPLLYPIKHIGQINTKLPRVSSHLQTWRGNERSYIHSLSNR